jgi:hypothetical protein
MERGGKRGGEEERAKRAIPQAIKLATQAPQRRQPSGTVASPAATNWPASASSTTATGILMFASCSPLGGEAAGRREPPPPPYCPKCRATIIVQRQRRPPTSHVLPPPSCRSTPSAITATNAPKRFCNASAVAARRGGGNGLSPRRHIKCTHRHSVGSTNRRPLVATPPLHRVPDQRYDNQMGRGSAETAIPNVGILNNSRCSILRERFASSAGGYAAAQPHAMIQQYPIPRDIALVP